MDIEKIIYIWGTVAMAITGFGYASYELYAIQKYGSVVLGYRHLNEHEALGAVLALMNLFEVYRVIIEYTNITDLMSSALFLSFTIFVIRHFKDERLDNLRSS